MTVIPTDRPGPDVNPFPPTLEAFMAKPGRPTAADLLDDLGIDRESHCIAATQLADLLYRMTVDAIDTGEPRAFETLLGGAVALRGLAEEMWAGGGQVTAATPSVGLVGNLTGDPELRFSAAGRPWMRARLSVQPYVRGAAEQPPAEFYGLVAFGSLAEKAAETLVKGDRVAVVGRLEDDVWTGRDGVERTTQKFICEGMAPDLRFRTATVDRTRRAEPVATAPAEPARPQAATAPAEAPTPTPVLDELVGPARSYSYSEEPF